MFEGWSTQCDTSWEVQAVFFLVFGWLVESLLVHFSCFFYLKGFRIHDVSALFCSFVLVEIMVFRGT